MRSIVLLAFVALLSGCSSAPAKPAHHHRRPASGSEGERAPDPSRQRAEQEKSCRTQIENMALQTLLPTLAKKVQKDFHSPVTDEKVQSNFATSAHNEMSIVRVTWTLEDGQTCQVHYRVTARAHDFAGMDVDRVTCSKAENRSPAQVSHPVIGEHLDMSQLPPACSNISF